MSCDKKDINIHIHSLNVHERLEDTQAGKFFLESCLFSSLNSKLLGKYRQVRRVSQMIKQII